MPLVQVRRTSRVTNGTLKHLLDGLPAVVASALSCEDNRIYVPDIMIEVSEASGFDRNLKDVNIRVLAHDYPERHIDASRIQRAISTFVQKTLPGGTTWYVWLFLSFTSYGSDTES